MSEKKPQSLENHAKFVPPYHFVLSTLLLIVLVARAWFLFRAPTFENLVNLLAAVGLILLFYYCRTFPLKVQDRLIRLEERLRLERLGSAEVRGRLDELTPNQMVALRFAGDAEVDALAKQVLEEGIDDRKEIKKRIKVWRPDYYRC